MVRKDYILTDEKIKKAYIEYIKEHGDMPTQQQVADICNITRETVAVHLNKINLKELVQPFKMFGNHVLMGLRNRAAKGDAQAAKLFFMLVYDWSERSEHKIDHSGSVPIQIIIENPKDAITKTNTKDKVDSNKTTS